MFKDSHTGKDSTSKTMYVIASVVLLAKVLLSGVAFGDFTGSTVDFIGLAAVHAIFASTYYGRAKTKSELGDIQATKSSN